MVLDYDDFANLKRRYPQTSRDRTVNYAFGGGSAAKLLLDADEVKGTHIKDDSIKDGREHKDLEVIAFNDVFGNKAPDPHNLLGIDFYGPLQVVDYANIPQHGIYVEILRDSYFGFNVPSTRDTRRVNVDGKRFVTLSPEFMLASKLFSTCDLRDIDYDDALRLLRKFGINREYLGSIIQDTRFAHLVSEEDLEDLECRVEDRSLFHRIEREVKQKYSWVLPEADDISYGVTVSLLEVEPEDLILTPEKAAFIDWTRSKLNSTGQVKGMESPAYELCMRYAFQHLNIFPEFPEMDLADFPERSRKYFINFPREAVLISTRLSYTLVNDNEHRAVAMALGINRTLSDLSEIGLEPWVYDIRSYRIANDISSSQVIHVKEAKHKREINEFLREKNEGRLN